MVVHNINAQTMRKKWYRLKSSTTPVKFIFQLKEMNKTYQQSRY